MTKLERRQDHSPARAFAAVALTFLTLTVLMTWPLAMDPAHRISDPFDPLLNTWILHWDWKQAFHDPLRLYDADIFHPARLTLAFSENLIGVAVFGFPLFFAGCSPITVYNVLFLLGMFLSGIGAWALARELTGDGLAAVVAGIIYEFVPFRFDHLAHIQIQWGGFLPLLLLFLWRYLNDRKAHDLVLFSLFFAWNGLVNVHYGFFGALAVFVTCAIELTRRDLWKDRRVLGGLAVALLAAGAILAPFYIPYVEASRLYKFRRVFSEIGHFSATLRSFLSAGARNRLYGGLTSRFRSPEGQLFFGATAIALTIFALLRVRRRDPVESPHGVRDVRRSVPWFDGAIVILAALRIAVAVTGGLRWRGVISIREPYRLSFLIALLLTARLTIAFPKFLGFRNLVDFLRRSAWPAEWLWAVSMLVLGILIAFGAHLFFYREIYELFPFLLAAIRVPNRGIVIAHLGLGVLAASGLSALMRRYRPPSREVVFAGICAAMLFEYRTAPLTLYEQDVRPWASSRFLTSRTSAGGLLELPMKDGDNTEYVYRTTEHGWPIVNGYSGFFPADFVALRDEVSRARDFAELLPLLRRLDARSLLFHSDRATAREWTALVPLLKSGIQEGSLSYVRMFDGENGPSILFEILDNPLSGRLFEVDAREEGRIRAFLDNASLAPGAPVGYLDSPTDGQVFAGNEVHGIGWAACPAGIERIVILLDGREAGSAEYGTPRPDVARAVADVLCGERCGYSFLLRNIPPGTHRLEARVMGRNGKALNIPGVRIHVRTATAGTSGGTR
jgi:hypothetical protein